MNFYLGIDFGTSGVRTSIINDQKEEIISQSEPIPLPQTDNIRTFQNPVIWWNALIKNISKLKKNFELDLIKCISVDGTSGTILISDMNGIPLSDALMYNDASAVLESKQVKELSSNHPIVSSTTNALVRALSLIKMLNVKSFRVLHQADWIASKIINNFSFSDENNSLKLGYDLNQQGWPQWMQQLPFEMANLPIVKLPGEKIGIVENKEFLSLGFNKNCEIVAGTTDGVASFLATGAKSIGSAVTSIGSTMAIKVISKNPINNREFGIYSHKIANKWLAGGASNVGGAILKKLFGEKIDELSNSLNPNKILGYNLYPLEKKGERFPFNDPDFEPKLSPRPQKETEYFQAILEGITSVEKLCYSKIKEIGGQYPKTIYTTGGGSRNYKWNLIRERILDVKIKNPLSAEASFGTALLAGGFVN